MITRAVPSIKAQSDLGSYASTDLQAQGQSSQDLLRQARIISLTGVLGQIAQVAEFACEIFQDLQHETIEVQDRMAQLHNRVDVLAQIVACQLHENREEKAMEELLSSLPLMIEEIPVASASASSIQDRPASIRAAYARCESLPPLEMLDCFYDSEQEGGSARTPLNGVDRNADSISRKKYSDPGFFMEEWLKNETARQHRILEGKEQRRRDRRLGQQRPQTRNLHRQSTESDAINDREGSDENEQKLTFLSIRSWKEIYGTGEGKELRKQPQRSRSPNRRVLRKKAPSSSVPSSLLPQRSEDLQQPIASFPPPPPLENSIDDATLTTEPFPTPSVETLSNPSSLQGAFMQEMDDNEITMDMQLEHDVLSEIPPPPPLPDVANSEELPDQTLSYYYDPATQHVQPPPPPLERTEEETSDSFYDAQNEVEEDIPPPPPFDDFDHVNDVDHPSPRLVAQPSQAGLFNEIKLGTALRPVSKRQSQAVPQRALLEQILQQQSRQLRPIESRPRPSLPTCYATNAPFANSIARILERRSVIAYESDSSNDDNDEW